MRNLNYKSKDWTKSKKNKKRSPKKRRKRNLIQLRIVMK